MCRESNQFRTCKLQAKTTCSSWSINPGGDQGVSHLVNHTCCIEHCNAEFLLTRALSGDPRMDLKDEEGAITLAVRAKKFIKRHETILVHYNPEAGIASWKDVFKCACCRCKGNADHQHGSATKLSRHSKCVFDKRSTSECEGDDQGCFCSHPSKLLLGQYRGGHK